jgi:hypothetical protein
LKGSAIAYMCISTLSLRGLRNFEGKVILLAMTYSLFISVWETGLGREEGEEEISMITPTNPTPDATPRR